VIESSKRRFDKLPELSIFKNQDAVGDKAEAALDAIAQPREDFRSCDLRLCLGWLGM
jgi:hypothetical protein